MKTVKKVVATTVCGAMLVAGSIAGTMAYLTSKDAVENTFTIGNVAITLDESKVNDDGTLAVPNERVKGNKYKLMPGHTYKKDPVVHFAAGSEESWLFVKVEDGISTIEDEDNGTIASQITESGWNVLDGVGNVYWKEVPANTNKDAVDYEVFKNFKVKNDANISGYEKASIKITAYAIQADGFRTAEDAWNAGKFGNTSTGTNTGE